jgi:hypothetical protein
MAVQRVDCQDWPPCAPLAGGGYADFLDAIADPKHERHEELLEWIGGSLDPAAFDPVEVDQIFATLAGPSS